MNVDLPDEAATQQLAQRGARFLPATSSPFILYLEGDLGVGKTTFARAMLQSLGETGAVRSPSYGLIAEYTPASGRVVHLDLYRLLNADELEQLGLRDYLEGSRLWLIEWADRVDRDLPPPDVRMLWSVAGAGRRVLASALTPPGQAWLASLTGEDAS
jgi:tRNA threonylcarbamoyladenosine biosynthesis protein TsaE